MDNVINGRICTNEQCKFTETDLCVEGNDVNECPYLQIRDATVAENDEDIKSPDSPAKQTVDELVHFGGEEHLSVTEASMLLKARYMPIIAFLGPPGAGKTSLIAEVYDAFHYGNYESLAFAGSETLMAFERICHKVRAASRAPEPMHDRSEILDDPFFFHLTINTSCDVRLVDILLADRSGENLPHHRRYTRHRRPMSGTQTCSGPQHTRRWRSTMQHQATDKRSEWLSPSPTSADLQRCSCPRCPNQSCLDKIGPRRFPRKHETCPSRI